MELTNFKQSDNGEKLELRHPVSGEILGDDNDPVTVTLVSRDSKEYAEAERKLQKERLRNRNKRLTREDIEEGAIEILIAVTKDWEGIDENGSKVEFSRENARRIYTFYPWLREQVDAFVHERGNFMKG